MVFGLLLAVYWPTLGSLPGTWNALYQEHGFFVGGLVVWLIWRDRRRYIEGAGRPLTELVPILALLSVVWLTAVIMNVGTVHQALLGVLFAGWALVVFGWDQRGRILPLAATFLLGVPFWSVFVPMLQRGTVIASGAITKAVGISAVIGYDYISISTGTFLVEAGCAGINYLMGGLVLGAFYAHMFTDRWQTQLKIVALAGMMSIVGNWIRVAVLIVLGEATAMQSPYIEDHLWQGWLIFSLLMVPTYLLARKLEVRDRQRAAGRAAEDVLIYDPPPHEPSPFAAHRPVDSGLLRRAVIAAAAVAVGPLLYMGVGSIPRPTALDRGTAPLGLVDSWTASEVDPAAPTWAPGFAGVDDRVAWRIRGEGVTLEGARHFFVDQRWGEELIQFSNQIAPDSLVISDRLLGPVGPRGRLVREALVRDGVSGRVVWYWYRVAGFDTPFASKAKLLEVLSFFGRSAAAELITLSAACDAESCLRAAQALRAATGGPPIPDSGAPSSSLTGKGDAPTDSTVSRAPG